jgi:phosphohistidine phosphatase
MEGEGMKTLLVLRHAKSSWDHAELTDHDRPLNRRGNRAAPRMGRLLVEQGLVPDLILSSTAERARTTAELVADECAPPPPIDYLPSLYGADPLTYLEAAGDAGDDLERVMVVGHNPGIESLVSLLTGSYERMPTAALACIELQIESWENAVDAKGRLAGLWRPKDLR